MFYFIEENGNSIEFSNQSQIEKLDINIFRQQFRKDNNLKEDKGERFAVVFYLKKLCKVLEFPFTLIKSEKPDFILKFPQKNVGVEVRQSTTTEYCKDVAYIGREKKGHLISFSANGHKVVEPNEPLSGPPICGNQDLEKFYNLVSHAIKSKIATINKDEFQHFDEDELVILNTYSQVLSEKGDVKLLEYLNEASTLNNVHEEHSFTKISFIKNGYLYYNLGDCGERI